MAGAIAASHSEHGHDELLDRESGCFRNLLICLIVHQKMVPADNQGSHLHHERFSGS